MREEPHGEGDYILEWVTERELRSREFTKILNDIRAVGSTFPDEKWLSSFKVWEYPKGFLWLRELQEKYGRPIKVMDFGCGVSPFPQFLANQGFEVWGVDDDSTGYIADLGLSNLKEVYPDVNYHIGNIHDLNEKFDVVASFSVLEHLDGETNRLDVYGQMKRLLGEDGKVCHLVDYYLPESFGKAVNFLSLVNFFDVTFDPAICPGSAGFELGNVGQPFFTLHKMLYNHANGEFAGSRFVHCGTRVMVAHDV